MEKWCAHDRCVQFTSQSTELAIDNVYVYIRHEKGEQQSHCAPFKQRSPFLFVAFVIAPKTIWGVRTLTEMIWTNNIERAKYRFIIFLVCCVLFMFVFFLFFIEILRGFFYIEYLASFCPFIFSTNNPFIYGNNTDVPFNVWITLFLQRFWFAAYGIQMPAISCCDHVFCTSSTIKCAKNEENQLCHLLPLDKTRNYNVSSRYATPTVHNIRSPYGFIVFFLLARNCIRGGNCQGKFCQAINHIWNSSNVAVILPFNPVFDVFSLWNPFRCASHSANANRGVSCKRSFILAPRNLPLQRIY